MAARLTARVAAAHAVVTVAALAAGCVAPHRAPTNPPVGVTPPPAAGRTDAARAAVVQALGAAGLVAADPQQPFRPPEGAWFAAAPRTIVQVSVPAETAPRFIVLYAFDSAADAASAAADQATYVARGPGRPFFPLDTRFTIRVLGSVAIFFAWSPANADPSTEGIQRALETIGNAVAIPA